MSVFFNPQAKQWFPRFPGVPVNIILNWVIIYPLRMEVANAVRATVIDLFVSMGLAMLCHYAANNKIQGDLKYIPPGI